METAAEIAARFVSDSYQTDLELAILRHFEDRASAATAALKEAERFMAYLSGETGRVFEGSGEPSKCLAQIRAALYPQQSATE